MSSVCHKEALSRVVFRMHFIQGVIFLIYLDSLTISRVESRGRENLHISISLHSGREDPDFYHFLNAKPSKSTQRLYNELGRYLSI